MENHRAAEAGCPVPQGGVRKYIMISILADDMNHVAVSWMQKNHRPRAAGEGRMSRYTSGGGGDGGGNSICRCACAIIYIYIQAEPWEGGGGRRGQPYKDIYIYIYINIYIYTPIHT